MIALIDIPCFLYEKKYASLQKVIEINFTPFPTLKIAFSCFLENLDQAYQEEYRKLLKISPNPTGIVVVESIVFYPEPKRSKYDFYISALSIRDSKERITSYVKLMKDFYGFTVDYSVNFWNEEDSL